MLRQTVGLNHGPILSACVESFKIGGRRVRDGQRDTIEPVWREASATCPRDTPPFPRTMQGRGARIQEEAQHKAPEHNQCFGDSCIDKGCKSESKKVF